MDQALSNSSEVWPRNSTSQFDLGTPLSSLSSDNKKPVDSTSDRAVTCLVAEANPIGQKILETLLTQMGCRCVLAADGAQAISVALGDISEGLGRQKADCSVEFDCILMDLHMPVVDGEQAAKYIKSINNKNTMVMRQLGFFAFLSSAHLVSRTCTSASTPLSYPTVDWWALGVIAYEFLLTGDNTSTSFRLHAVDVSTILTSTHATAITKHADLSRTKGVTQGMMEKGREWKNQIVKLQLARERRAKEAQAKEAAHVKSQTQRKAIETMVAAGLSTEEIQEYLDDPDADASDSDDGGESIDYINEAPVPIEDKQFMPLATYLTSASQTLQRPSGFTQRDTRLLALNASTEVQIPHPAMKQPTRTMLQNELWAIECWKNGCEQKGQEFALTDVHKKLIMDHHSTIHGGVEDKVALKAAVYYGFRHGTDDVTIQANKTLAEVLIQEDGYDVAKSMGIYAHPILQEIINEQWFDSKKADGIKYSASFHPIPNASIGLVFTAVEFVISRWASGRHVKGGAFAGVLFHYVYIRHLKGLEAWRSFNAKSAKSLARLKENLHYNGRALTWAAICGLHARLLILQDDPKPHFNMMKSSLATQAIESSNED
ncbi:hypothetical protein JB92DRAFT_3140775 [Gautieria morchelliformis]|nr:hypothetical protein JB92DRAFT_3140775 [Gautieria morchelliformis]